MKNYQFAALCAIVSIGLFHNITVGIFLGVVLIVGLLFTAKAPAPPSNNNTTPHPPPSDF